MAYSRLVTRKTKQTCRHFPCSLFKDSHQGLKYQTKEALSSLLSIVGQKAFAPFCWASKVLKHWWLNEPCRRRKWVWNCPCLVIHRAAFSSRLVYIGTIPLQWHKQLLCSPWIARPMGNNVTCIIAQNAFSHAHGGGEEEKGQAIHSSV